MFCQAIVAQVDHYKEGDRLELNVMVGGGISYGHIVTATAGSYREGQEVAVEYDEASHSVTLLN